MKIQNIRVSMIQTDTDWDAEGERFLGIKDITCHAYGETEKATTVNVNIKLTPAEFAEFLVLIHRIEERVNKEGEV